MVMFSTVYHNIVCESTEVFMMWDPYMGTKSPWKWQWCSIIDLLAYQSKDVCFMC